MQDVRRFHQAFYGTQEKIVQDSFILKYTTTEPPQRKRVKLETSSRKTAAVKYYMKTRGGETRVCQNTFLSILGVSKDRVQRICSRHLLTGLSPKENRGGDRQNKIYSNRKIAVKQFIEHLKPIELHYTRDKSTRQYLPSKLSIRKLWTAYNHEHEDPNLKVRYHYFREIFITDYNLSFGSPATDACSECINLRAQLKRTDIEHEDKENIRLKLHLHKLKAKCFFDMLKKEGEYNVLKLSFDCQKNMVLPKVPDQTAYYSRQLYLYNFTICEGNSTSVQNEDTVTMYTWLEHERPKGSNEIVSAVYHKLKSTDLTRVSCLKLFADGCPGQNKNSTTVGMIMKWLQCDAPNNIKNVEIIFPVVGHSYIPPDRVFGRLEKMMRKRDTIIHAEEYLQMFAACRNIVKLGSECQVFDRKTEVSSVLKPPGQWHFKFALVKRLLFKKTMLSNVLLRGEVNFRVDTGAYKSINRKGKQPTNIKPIVLATSVPVKPKKLKDVDKLLQKHFGPEWRNHEDLGVLQELNR